MAVTINASTSSGLVQTADTSGVITLQNNGTDALSVSSGNLQFNSGYGSVATAYGVRAWVSYKGTATRAINASGNVTSVTVNGTGDFTINFTTALADTNYAVAGGPLEGSGNGSNLIVTYAAGGYGTAPTLKTTTQYRFITMNQAVATDAFNISLAFIR